jgi:hypothetical protein
LNTLFPINSVIYIAGNPFVITDLQWSSGNWKIDTKRKKEAIDSNKVTNPYLYQSIVQDEIISGKNQLAKLPDEIIYGPNYNGEHLTRENNKPIENNVENPLIKTNVENPLIKTNVENPLIKTNVENPLIKTNVENNKPIENNKPLIENNKPLIENNKPLIENNKPLIENNVENVPLIKKNVPLIENNVENVPLIKKNVPLIENGNNENEVPLIKKNLPLIENDNPFEIIEEIRPEIKPPPELLQNSEEPLNKLIISTKSTMILKKIFSSKSFYYLINTIYKLSNPTIKKFIQNGLQQSTKVNIKGGQNLSELAYNESVSGIRIIQNDGKGDCFFIAVADALNYYNFYNQSSRIISKRYGTGTHFYTQKYVRSLVYEFIQSWDELDNQLENIAPSNVDNLNNIFSTHLKDQNELSPEKYIELAQEMYNSNDNFLVESVDSVPIDVDDYDKPFKIIKKNNLQNYILSSNYWANYVAIYALSVKLKLNVIPINTKDNDSINIPFANFNIEYDTWKKYLFVYYKNNHFELFTFNENFIEKKTNLSKKIIFSRSGSITDLPPIYILFVIYGGYYCNIRDKNKFTFQKEIMKLIDNTVNTKVNALTDSKIFYSKFKFFFPNSLINNLSEQKGGVYLAKNMIKQGEINNSQLAYYITIDLDLYPGTSIPPEDITKLKCRHKWNSVRKSYSEFMENPYVIIPVYQKSLKRETKVGGKKTRKKHF